jgi:Peptidase family M23
MEPHHGIDLAMPEGTTLRTIGEGVVDRVYDGSSAIGKGCSIKFEDGTRAIYGHMNEVNVEVGQHVNSGDILGESGSTGLSTGSHLHFGLREGNGDWLNPTPLAEHLANISGDNPIKELKPPSDFLFGVVGETIREKTSDVATEVLLGIFDALKDLLLGVSLLGAGILILLRVAGWRDGGRWAGVLIVINILIKFFAAMGGV